MEHSRSKAELLIQDFIAKHGDKIRSLKSGELYSAHIYSAVGELADEVDNIYSMALRNALDEKSLGAFIESHCTLVNDAREDCAVLKFNKSSKIRSLDELIRAVSAKITREFEFGAGDVI